MRGASGDRPQRGSPMLTAGGRGRVCTIGRWTRGAWWPAKRPSDAGVDSYGRWGIEAGFRESCASGWACRRCTFRARTGGTVRCIGDRMPGERIGYDHLVGEHREAADAFVVSAGVDARRAAHLPNGLAR